MSVIFQVILNCQKLISVQKSLKYSSTYRKCLFSRNYSDKVSFETFSSVTSRRRAQAQRSIVVQVQSQSSLSELNSYCSKYADVQSVHHYSTAGGEHFMLIEFATESNTRELLQNCGVYQKNNDLMALPSPFLWFRAAPDKKQTTSPNSINCENGILQIDDDKLIEDMKLCESVSQQIEVLYNTTKLNEICVRLKYIVARQLEMMLDSVYANVEVQPFGSSVNGFGKIGCDLDLVLTNNLTDTMTEASRRLVYQQKRPSERGWQRDMELVAALLEARCGGVARVVRILHARVPILKFAHDIAALDVDLCYNNLSGVYMSELLYLLGSVDRRVAPLVFTVRRWASANGLTSAQPGRWITNFSLTVMVLFFLQQPRKGGAILPPFKYLLHNARKTDVRIAEDNLSCTFLRDLNLMPADMFTQNDASLGSLLLEFFEFYSQFDFQSKAISIKEGAALGKPNYHPLYIMNPLDTALNVSRNVSYEECERIKTQFRNAAWQMEAALDGKREEYWGLLCLTEKISVLNLKSLVNAGNSHRLIELEQLFSEEADGAKETRCKVKNAIKSVSQKKSTNKSVDVDKVNEKIIYKNPQVKKEVIRIRRNKMT